MGSHAQDNAAIMRRFQKQWVYTPIIFSNTDAKSPENEPWVKIEVLPQSADIASLGVRSIRYDGIISVQIFTVKGSGSIIPMDLADKVVSIYNLKDFDDVECFESQVLQLGENPQGWFQVNVSTPFHRDEF